jgi:hypothetical protein
MSETSVIRKKGRGIALSRALVAINKNLICPIVTARPMIILQNINFPEEGKFPVDWKGEYPCRLTRFEENLVMKASKGGQ